MMSENTYGWYVARGGEQRGPMSFADVQGMLQRGEVVAADYVAGPGVNGWTLISAVPALSLSSGLRNLARLLPRDTTLESSGRGLRVPMLRQRSRSLHGGGSD